LSVADSQAERHDGHRRDEELPNKGVARGGRKGFGNVERASVARLGDVPPRIVGIVAAAEGHDQLTAKARAAAGVLLVRGVGIFRAEVDGNAVVDFVAAVRNHNVGGYFRFSFHAAHRLLGGGLLSEKSHGE